MRKREMNVSKVIYNHLHRTVMTNGENFVNPKKSILKLTTRAFATPMKNFLIYLLKEANISVRGAHRDYLQTPLPPPQRVSLSDSPPTTAESFPFSEPPFHLQKEFRTLEPLSHFQREFRSFKSTPSLLKSDRVSKTLLSLLRTVRMF